MKTLGMFAGMLVVGAAMACGGLVRSNGPEGPDAAVGPEVPWTGPRPSPGPEPGPTPTTAPTSVPTGPSTGPIGPTNPPGGSIVDAGPTTPRFDASPPPPPQGPACYDQNMLVGSLWTGPALAHRNLCTPEQITGLYEACYGPSATGQRCITFTSALVHVSCVKCIQGYSAHSSELDGVPQPAIVSDGVGGQPRYQANVNACASALVGLPDCGTAMTDIAICKTNSCYTCSTADHAACVARAAGGICKSLIDDNQVTCLDPIEANRATWETACGANAPNFAQAFATVSATMCGE